MNLKIFGMPANNDDELVASMAWLLRDGHPPDLVLYGLRAYVKTTQGVKPRHRENPR